MTASVQNQSRFSASAPEDKVEGKVTRIIYRAPTGDMQVLLIKLDDGTPQTIRQVGTILEVNDGDHITAVGGIVRHKRFGLQFQARDMYRRIPTTGAGYVKVLSGKQFKGIGKGIAQKLVDHFGADLPSLLNRGDPAGLISELIGPKKGRIVLETWLANHAANAARARLADLKVDAAICNKIIEGYPDFERILRDDPYRFAREIDGVGFKTADQLAKNAGTFKEDSPGRLSAGVHEAMDQSTRNGHSGLSYAQLVDQSCDVLTFSDRRAVSQVIDEALQNGTLVQSPNNLIQRANVARIETRLARNIVRLARSKPHQFNPAHIARTVSTVTQRYRLTDEQSQAVQAAMIHGLLVITGGPGTGKTTTLKALEEAWVMLCRLEGVDGASKLLQLSPTGKAADRMEESTGRPASTVHMGLGRDEDNPGAGFKHHEANPLPHDLVIIDEFSMMDTRISDSLLRALKHCRVVLVGDINQLPSVDYGRVLNDIIESEICPVVRLTRVHRTGPGSSIAIGAAAICEGRMPVMTGPGQSDFVFIEHDNPDEAADRIISMMADKIPNNLGISIPNIQVLTPGKNSSVGLHALNARLQNACNPNPPLSVTNDNDRAVIQNGHQLRMSDRVICMKTVYDNNVYNGDSGSIEGIEVQGDDAQVEFVSRRKTLNLDRSYWSNMDLAYALTIHKSQGSEFDVVIIPLTKSHYMMLKRNLIYTGVTRAKKLCIIVGSRDALRIAINTPDGTIRQTGLLARIKQYA